MQNLVGQVRDWLGSEQGQDLAEYALLIGLIALVLFIAVTVLGGNLSSVFSTLSSHVGSW
jgi:Flp pilus assembly pilin Flp